MKHKPSKKEIKEEDLAIIRSDEKSRGKWKIAIVYQLFKGEGGVIQGVCLRVGKSYLERPIQCLYPLELNCNVNPVKSNTNTNETKPNIKAEEFRAKRNDAAIAKLKIRKDIMNEENSG